MKDDSWLVEGAQKDRQSITADWTFTGSALIHGVAVREVRHVTKESGNLTEVYRRDWGLSAGEVAHVFKVRLRQGRYSAWHAHAVTTDRLFVDEGEMRLMLFDGRADSPTRGLVNELRFGMSRPALVIVPPRVWHGLMNLSDGTSSVLNLVDREYQYEDPDHWRVPFDSPSIPCCVLHGKDCPGH